MYSSVCLECVCVHMYLCVKAFFVTVIDDLQFVIKALHTMSPYWKGIGISLQVEGLDEIRKRFRNDPLKCLIGVVDKWLKDPRGSSWRKLVSVVADKVGGANRQTATYIARHYRGKPVKCNACV